MLLWRCVVIVIIGVAGHATSLDSTTQIVDELRV